MSAETREVGEIAPAAARRPGHVALVGAGPGDPGLLTLRAAELIRAADVVAHDELISEAVLAMVPARAELVAVGRRIGAGRASHRLHPVVRERALRGLRVVRLKAGDPLIFGRGGEEAQELVELGVPFEIVPGISAAIAAAAYAGVPLTHRDHAAQLVITSGHRRDGGLPPPATLAGRTLALYMAAHELDENLAQVIAEGWPRSTPAVLVASATCAAHREVAGTLATLAARCRELGVPAAGHPAVVLVGEVGELHATLSWHQRRPLAGARVVLARARPAPSELGRQLRDLGATVMELPHVTRAPSAARDLVAAAAGCEVALLSDADAVPAWLERGPALPALALGADVAALLAAAGRPAVAELRGACASAFAEQAARIAGRRVLVLAASDHGALLPPLRELGAEAVVVPVATSGALAPARWPSGVDLVVLPSSLAALALYAEAPAALREVPAVAIGARSAQQARASGARTVHEAEEDSLEAVVQRVLQLRAGRAA